jgi:hypothetical protein
MFLSTETQTDSLKEDRKFLGHIDEPKNSEEIFESDNKLSYLDNPSFETMGIGKIAREFP